MKAGILKDRGFTLIELLIVVAIIAILAAIAVPNFLEAQVRAKVSRVKADMRSTATALEAYRTDNPRYPPDFSDVAARGGNFPPAASFHSRLLFLTTPIAYITTVVPDAFATEVRAGSADGQPAPYSPTNPSVAYHYNSNASNPLDPVATFDYAKFDRDGAVPNDSITVWDDITTQPESIQWALNSPGPDVTRHVYLGFSALQVYDPTNGTVSFGQIIRTNISAEDQPKS